MLKMRTRKETEFYIKADAIMNKVAWHRSWLVGSSTLPNFDNI